MDDVSFVEGGGNSKCLMTGAESEVESVLTGMNVAQDASNTGGGIQGEQVEPDNRGESASERGICSLLSGRHGERRGDGDCVDVGVVMEKKVSSGVL